MTDVWTADGWCGRDTNGVTTDGWPEASTPCTIDGWFLPDPVGGYYETAYERHLIHRRSERRRELEIAREAQEAAKDDPLQAELAKYLHEQLARQAKHDDLLRMQRIVTKQTLDRSLPDKVQKAFERAQTNASFSRLLALEREFIKMQEEEELALLLTLSLLN